jgi:DNA invertase Pin-like site-specific DNA recombinase
MLHAYARVSTQDQDPRLQLDALTRARADRIWQERLSAADHRPQLEAMLSALQPGDEVLVWKLDRLARSLRHLLDIIDTITKAGASLRSLTEPIDTGSALGRMMLQLLGSFSEFERGLIKERCAAGRIAARARGVPMGRPQSVDRHRAADLLRAGLTHREAAQQLGCSRHTISRLLTAGELPGFEQRVSS